MTAMRIGVIGVGHHGRHHARNLALMPDVTLVGVVDTVPETAEQTAASFQTTAFPHPHDLLGKVDAVSIAVPTVQHFEVAQEFLKAGIPTLVEKPLSLSAAQGKRMVDLARQNGALLMVGHIERFNPAWMAVEHSGIRPNFIEATRHSRYPFRSLDVSVVFDVMIHDLDLVLSTTGSTIKSIQALGGTLLSSTADWAEVRLELANGCVANLSASRVHHSTERRIRLSSPNESLEVDFLRRLSIRHSVDLTTARERLGDVSPRTTPEERETLLKEMFEVGCVSHDREAEPLRRELEEFVAAARGDREPKVTGEQGLAAVIAADQIDRAIHQRSLHRPMRQSA